jgi:vancomycin resistance protein YoaR
MMARRPPRTGNPGRYLGRFFLLLFAAASLVFHTGINFAVADYAVTGKTIHSGVKIYNADLSRLSQSKAKALLNGKIKEAVKKDIIIKDKKGTWKAEVIFLKPQGNVNAAVKSAYDVGRSGRLLANIWTRAKLYFEPATLSVPAKINEEYAGLTADKVAAAIDRPAQDATVVIEGETAEIVASKDGWAINKAGLIDLIRIRVADFSSRNVTVPQGIARVKVHNDDAEKARKVALRMMKDPIAFTINERDYEISTGKIGTLIGFVPEKKKVKKGGKTVTEYVLKARLAKDKLEQYFIPIKDEFEVKPVNARFEAGEGVVTIIPGVNGMGIDIDAAVTDLNKLALAAPPRHAVLRMVEIEPELSTAKAEAMGIKERVSVHTEYFDFTVNRSTNIRVLAESLDGMIVAPNQVWSINEATGPRTPGKGYTEAPVIVNGQLSPDIGGGICNVSTTIFNTAFFGGYEIIERYPHDFYISHYPNGRDASIYYDGGMDFKFKNDTPYHVLIKTEATDSSITIAFYSTKTDTTVDYTDTGFTNIIGFGITYKDDPAIPTGWEKDAEMGYGVEGRDITVFRTVKRGGAVVREDKFVSHYEPKQRLVLKGTGPALPPNTPPPPGLRPLGQTPPQT